MKIKLHVLTGSLGLSKNFFTNFLKQYWESEERLILLTTTTSIVALRLHKTTQIVHTTFNIPTKGELKTLYCTSITFDDLSKASVIIVEECSMLTNDIVKHIVAHIHEVSQGAN